MTDTVLGVYADTSVDTISMFGEMWIRLLLFSWMVSFTLLLFHFNGKMRSLSPVLLRGFFVIETIILMLWYLSTMHDYRPHAYGELRDSFTVVIMEMAFSYVFLFMLSAALRLFLLNCLDLIARKMDATLGEENHVGTLKSTPNAVDSGGGKQHLEIND